MKQVSLVRTIHGKITITEVTSNLAVRTIHGKITITEVTSNLAKNNKVPRF